ncbi:MAG: hypothetical protein Q9169_007874, partial [Polycauliona sp. 2 TL-2023]
FTVSLGSTIVFGPIDRPPTAEMVSQILDHAHLDGMIVPPSLLENLYGNVDTLAKVKKLKYVQYASAPLRKKVGDLIANEVRLVSAFGSIEAGAWFPRVQQAADWNYSSFMTGTGIEFEHRGDDELYELIFRRQDEYRRWEQIFDVYPDLNVFHTKDLFTKHPTKDDLWAYAGRADDIVTFSHGIDVHAAKLEGIIESDPRIRGALVGGDGRPRPFLILELSEALLSGAAESTDRESSRQQAKINDIWSAVKIANEQCLQSARLTKALTLMAGADQPLPRTAKGNIARHDAAALYAKQIDMLYAR